MNWILCGDRFLFLVPKRLDAPPSFRHTSSFSTDDHFQVLDAALKDRRAVVIADGVAIVVADAQVFLGLIRIRARNRSARRSRRATLDAVARGAQIAHAVFSFSSAATVQRA